AMGAFTYLLVEESCGAAGRGGAGRAVIIVMLAGITGYLAMTMQPTNFLLFCAAPLALLGTLYRSVDPGVRPGRENPWQAGARGRLGGFAPGGIPPRQRLGAGLVQGHRARRPVAN